MKRWNGIRVLAGALVVAAGVAVRGQAADSAGVTIAAPLQPVPGTTPVGPNVPRQLRINIAWQVALDGCDFSPGIIDGVFKTKGVMALREYATRNYPGKDIYGLEVYQGLKVDVEGALAEYQITADDVAQVGGSLPDDWNAKAAMSRLNYETLADCISEKFHCTVALLETLNPGMKAPDLTVGRKVVVPNVRPYPADNRVMVAKRTGAAFVMVNLMEKTIRVFDSSSAELALFHCSIAKDKNKLPDRDTKVNVIAAPNPNYTFNPAVWPEVHNVSRILTIPPGPRNPVGLAWVSLDLPGYGIHGTPKPEMIGKTGSHGCFRLCNWDALKFAGWVREGMTVKVVSPDASAQ